MLFVCVVSLTLFPSSSVNGVLTDGNRWSFNRIENGVLYSSIVLERSKQLGLILAYLKVALQGERFPGMPAPAKPAPTQHGFVTPVPSPSSYSPAKKKKFPKKVKTPVPIIKALPLLLSLDPEELSPVLLR